MPAKYIKIYDMRKKEAWLHAILIDILLFVAMETM